VYRVEVMPLQSAGQAGEAHLVWLQEGADEAQKQCYPEDHDDHRDEAAGGSLKGDVAEAGCRQRGYRKYSASIWARACKRVENRLGSLQRQAVGANERLRQPRLSERK